MKHTPGPWYITSKPDQPDYIETDKKPIAQICGLQHTKQEGEANARLIAAAPDLLLQLECALTTLKGLSNLKLTPIDLLAQQIEETLSKL